MNTDELRAKLAKLKAVHPQETGLRAGETAKLIEELIGRGESGIRGKCVAIGGGDWPRILVRTSKEEIIRYQNAVNSGLFMLDVEVRLVGAEVKGKAV